MVAQVFSLVCFFFQAEDGIRDLTVTGVQTCALPICAPAGVVVPGRGPPADLDVLDPPWHVALNGRSFAPADPAPPGQPAATAHAASPAPAHASHRADRRRNG